MARSDNPPRIATLIADIRKDVGGLKASKKDGVAFPVKSAKDLMAKLRDSLDKHGAHCYVVGQDVTNIEVDRGTACMVQSKVRLAAEDGSFVDFVGVGHGADSQDKASGKASTYAWKDALCKGLDLPDAEMVDTDDSDAPLPGGVKTLKKGRTRIGDEPEAKPATEYVVAIANATSANEVRGLLSKWRAEGIDEALAHRLGPIAKERIAELTQ